MSTPIFLETDLEPDDVLALYIMAKRGFWPRYVVVGEGNVEMKVARAQQYHRLLLEQGCAYRDCTIVAGQAAKNQRSFAGEGEEFAPAPAPIADMARAEMGYAACLRAYVEQGGCHFVCIKPPRELCANLGVVKGVLPRLKAFFYGSFNLRRMEDKALLTEAMSLFEQTVIYETFPALGQVNTMTKSRCPKAWGLIEKSRSANPYLAALCRLVSGWNAHIRDDGRDTCLHLLGAERNSAERLQPFLSAAEAASSEEQRHDAVLAKLKDEGFAGDAERFWRNFRVYREYLDPDALGTTVVMADVGLAVCMENPTFAPFLKMGCLSFAGTGYTQVTPPADSAQRASIGLYRDIFKGGAPYAHFDAEIAACLA